MLQETAWITADYKADTFTIDCHNINPALISVIVSQMEQEIIDVEVDNSTITLEAECMSERYAGDLDDEFGEDGWGKQEWFNYFYFYLNNFFEDNNIDLGV